MTIQQSDQEQIEFLNRLMTSKDNIIDEKYYKLSDSEKKTCVATILRYNNCEVKFKKVEGTTLKGSYNLNPSKTWDSALSFTANMYKPETFMCISFTGPYKHFKLSKGGAILTDNLEAYYWFKRARYSGRRECSYHDDYFDMLGWNFYMMPELAARGVLLMNQFYNIDGSPKYNDDLTLPYPDLSKFEIYKK